MRKHKMIKYILCLLLTLAVTLTGLTGCGSSRQESEEPVEKVSGDVVVAYDFRYEDALQQHYEKHGVEMGFASPGEYLAAANAVIANPDALTKTEKEDGDTVYYVKDTNEFVVLSTDGYIRTYFCPDDGIGYFNRQ